MVIVPVLSLFHLQLWTIFLLFKMILRPHHSEAECGALYRSNWAIVKSSPKYYYSSALKVFLRKTENVQE